MNFYFFLDLFYKNNINILKTKFYFSKWNYNFEINPKWVNFIFNKYTKWITFLVVLKYFYLDPELGSTSKDKEKEDDQNQVIFI